MFAVEDSLRMGNASDAEAVSLLMTTFRYAAYSQPVGVIICISICIIICYGWL